MILFTNILILGGINILTGLMYLGTYYNLGVLTLMLNMFHHPKVESFAQIPTLSYCLNVNLLIMALIMVNTYYQSNRNTN